MSVLAPFEGAWRLERQVENAVGPDATFSGVARFLPDGEGLTLHEAGEMRLVGQGGFRAERRYLWRTSGEWIAVFFDDLRPFHAFDPSAPRPEAEHPCAPDHYRVAYDFTAWPRWHATWRVEGPRKSYVMRSEYFR